MNIVYIKLGGSQDDEQKDDVPGAVRCLLQPLHRLLYKLY